MDCLKDLESMYGQITLPTKEILSKDLEMVMEFGMHLMDSKIIKDIICLIGNMVMASMIGLMDIFIKVIF